MKSIKFRTTPVVKFLIAICYTVLLLFLVSCPIYQSYHFPRNTLSNYPSTHWQCEKLGLELYVDEDGNISGFLNTDSKVISLEVMDHSSTTFHSNYIHCIDSNSNIQMIYLHCFYKSIDDGKFYVIVESSKTTFDLPIIPDEIPYKFILVEN